MCHEASSKGLAECIKSSCMMPFPILSVAILRKFAENKANNLRKTCSIR